MKVNFKQFSSFLDLPDEEITEEKIDEIFGSFFGGKVKPKNPIIARMQDKKQAFNPKDTAVMQRWQLAAAKNKKSLVPDDAVDAPMDTAVMQRWQLAQAKVKDKKPKPDQKKQGFGFNKFSATT